jgi:hypothetical protein
MPTSFTSFFILWLFLPTQALSAERATKRDGSEVDQDNGQPEDRLPYPDEGGSPIVGGEPAQSPGATVAIFRDGSFGCTGTLIAPRHVLTAGHCSAGITHVVMDTLDFADGGTLIDVIDVAVVEQYWTSYDLAVLELVEEAPVPPQALLLDCLVDNYLEDGAPVRLAGFGATNPNGTEFGSVLMSADTIALDADCVDFNFGCNEDVSPGGELVAGGAGVDSCIGDSGGPVFVQTEVGERLIGVTSRGIDQAEVPCGDGGIYARPDAALDWIEEQVGAPLERPDCANLNDKPVPSAPLLIAVAPVGAAVQVQPNDPDEGDTHTYEIVDGPRLGYARVSASGRLFYYPDATEGDDALKLRVTDSGSPPLSAEFWAQVRIEQGSSEPRGCSCGSFGGPRAASWLLLLLLARRRR